MVVPKVGQICFDDRHWYMILSIKRAALKNLDNITTEVIKLRFGYFYIDQEHDHTDWQFEAYFEYEFLYQSLDGIRLTSIP